MNRYYVRNKTRRSYCIIESKDIIEVGQKVLVKFDNEGIDELCECEVLLALKKNK